MPAVISWKDTYRAARKRTAFSIGFGIDGKPAFTKDEYQKIEPMVEKILGRDEAYRKLDATAKELVVSTAASHVKLEFIKTRSEGRNWDAEGCAENIWRASWGIPVGAVLATASAAGGYFAAANRPDFLAGAIVAFLISGAGTILLVRERIKSKRELAGLAPRLENNMSRFAEMLMDTIRNRPDWKEQLLQTKTEIINVSLEMLASIFGAKLAADREFETKELGKKVEKLGLRYDDQGNLTGVGKK